MADVLIKERGEQKNKKSIAKKKNTPIVGEEE